MEEESTAVVYDRNAVEEKTTTFLHTCLNKLEAFWKDFGIDEQQKKERAEVVVTHVMTLLDDLVKEENNLHDKLNTRIQNYRTELEELSRDLQIVPTMPDENFSLLEKERLLRMQLDELEQERHRRLKEFKQVKGKQMKLCNCLGITESNIGNDSMVPSIQELRDLEQEIRMLEEEYALRSRKFRNSKKELTTIMETTEFSPETSFERDVICYEDDNFVLSKENLEELNRLIEKARQRKEKMEREKENLLSKLQNLWNRLNVDEEERTAFLAKNSECRTSTLQALVAEIEKYEEIKRQNIGQYIQKLRDEIRDLWEKCYISEETQLQFRPFYDEEYSEELLDLHDAEVQRLRKHFEETKDIFEKIKKRDELWNLMLAFERKASDPNRFTNRGGNLLQEEKERKKILKNLPKLEDEISLAIKDYEEANNTTFLINGVSFLDRITAQWSEHRQEKENIKLERHKQKSDQLGTDAQTPSKRQLFATPTSAPSKLRRMNSGMSTFRTPGAPSKLLTPFNGIHSVSRSCGPTPRIIRRSSRFIVSKNINPCPAIQEKPGDPQSIAHDTTSYSEFAKELNKNGRQQYRSSVVSKKRKVLGSKASHSGSFRKSSSRISFSRSSNKSGRNTTKTASNKSTRSSTKTPTKLTPVRGKLGLPFLI